MSDHRRCVAVALPAKNEADHLHACIAALDAAAARFDGHVSIMVVANNCDDASHALLAAARLRHADLHWTAVSLLPEHAHAGWARRIAFDAAAALLSAPGDMLMSTDADTDVSPDWITRAAAHLDGGADAVAGRALTRRNERGQLGVEAARRLNLLGRYYVALDWLRSDRAPISNDPWPRHYYEGGASIALRLDTYRLIGGAPTPPLAEDRALFAAVRAVGGTVRHPLDVRVFTSSRLAGRAPGGMADAFARWITQGETEPLHETYAFPAALDPERAGAADQLSFATLPAAVAQAAAMIRSRRSRTAPQVEAILLPALFAERLYSVPQQSPESIDGLVT